MNWLKKLWNFITGKKPEQKRSFSERWPDFTPPDDSGKPRHRPNA